MNDGWIAAGVLGAFLSIFGGLFGSMAYDSHLIGASADPVATACALGRDKACVIVAARRP